MSRYALASVSWSSNCRPVRSGVLGTIGTSVTRRVLGETAGRWVPLAGAAAVGAYAYWDTLQVAKTARRLLEAASTEPPARTPTVRAPRT